MVEISQALSQLAEIQDKLSRTQVYRGYRPRTVAFTAACALLGGYLSRTWNPATIWPLTAVFCLSVVAGEMAFDYASNFSSHQQRLARRVLIQFLPGLALGAAWTGVWVHSAHPIALLPALWTMCYAFCLLSARTLLPAGVGYVAVFYGLSSLALTTPVCYARFNLGMTLAFGLGQSLLALILHWNQPRKEAE